VYDSFAGNGARTASLDDLLTRLARGEFDLVAVGRALLQDPGWLEKIRQGRVDDIEDFSPTAFSTLR
jgi:2,4-dienoyl-CoA reductase-like NADH-dependent reductase (Old Yellow Enzyme family)